MTVQFSGGEPTISPIFLDAVRYAREVGYFSVQAATNGIRFAQDADFARQAREAGLRIAYLQFDGVSEEANAHRKVGNLFDVKLRAIENLYAAGIDVVPGRHDRQHRQQRSGRPDRQVRRSRTATRSASSRSSRSRSPAATKTSPTRAAREALHALAPRRGLKQPDRRHRTAARLVPALGVQRHVGRHRSAAGPGRRLGHR